MARGRPTGSAAGAGDAGDIGGDAIAVAVEAAGLVDAEAAVTAAKSRCAARKSISSLRSGADAPAPVATPRAPISTDPCRDICIRPTVTASEPEEIRKRKGCWLISMRGWSEEVG